MTQTLQFISSKAEVVAGVLKDMAAHPSTPNMEAIEYVEVRAAWVTGFNDKRTHIAVYVSP